MDRNRKVLFFVILGIILSYLFMRFFVTPRMGFVYFPFGLLDIIALSFLVMVVYMVYKGCKYVMEKNKIKGKSKVKEGE